METDVAPELIEAVAEDFHRAYEDSERIQKLLKLVRDSSATYEQAQEYAIEVSRLIGAAYEKNVSSAVLPDGRMYYNIASRLIPSSLDENYSLVSDYAASVQQKLNEQAGIGIRAQVPPKNQDRIDGLVNMVSGAEQYDDVSGQLLSAFENFSQSIVDESVKANVDFQGKAGLRPRIIRKAEFRCCKWCSNLAGTYDYPDVPEDVYRRHENCRCTVEYDPGSGKRQNVHTKQWFTDPETSAIIEKRKIIGLRTNNVTITDISQHAYDRVAERNVTIEAIKNAIEYPLSIGNVKYDSDGRPSIKIVGEKATLTVNPDTGVITTVYPTHSKTANKLLGRK